MQILSSLKRALTFHFLLVAILPVFLFGLIGIQIISENQLNGVRQQNMHIARDVGSEVAEFLQEIEADLHHVAVILDDTEVLQAASLDRYLALVVKNSRFLDSIYLLGTDLKVKTLGLRDYEDVIREDFIKLDFSTNPLFVQEQAFDVPRWSNTSLSLVSNEPSVSLVIPVKHGYLLGNINLKKLSLLIQRYDDHAPFETAVIGRDGTFIAHSDGALVMQRVNFGNHPTVALALDGEETTGEFQRGGRTILESAAIVAPTGWCVTVGLDLGVVLAPVERMRLLLLVFMGLAVAMAVPLTFFNLRRLMRPLTSLGEQAGRVAEGHYAFNFTPSGYDEIDELASRFVGMSRAIQIREESIVASEQRFRDLVNSIDGIVWEMEYPSFRFLFVSRQAETLLGYPVKAWMEDPTFWEQKVYPKDARQAKAYCQLMAEKHQDHNFDYRMIAADGRVVWIRDLVTVVVEKGRPRRLLGVMIDITPQRELLEELERSEQNYREIFNASGEAIFIHDAHTGRLVDVNQAMLEMFRCSYEEALLKGAEAFSEGVSPYSADEAREKLRIAFEEGGCTFPWHARRATGELFWVEVSLQRGTIGGQPRILAAVRDITARREAENELAGYRARLEELVQERTRQLEEAQDELVQKERLAVLGRLTATVSHEIRNPLGTIANSLEHMRSFLEETDGIPVERSLRLAERNVERCDSIISELLDFSRQRELSVELVEIDVWLNDLLEETVFPDDLDVRKELASSATVHSDPERLRRAVVNVITNAIQAMEEIPEERRSLIIASRVVGERCEIMVTDSGPGMSEKVMVRIFEPMFSTKNFGVGLGVPIIKNIMESHGGGVEYHSEVGQGTTVTLWLPLKLSEHTPGTDGAPFGVIRSI